MEVKNRVEYNRQLEDLKNYPKSRYNGEYRGWKWEMKRPYGTYWCGYIFPPDKYELTNEEISLIEGQSHFELTSGLGFDCSHYDDYNHSEMTGEFDLGSATFKTYGFVYQTIRNMIDSVA